MKGGVMPNKLVRLKRKHQGEIIEEICELVGEDAKFKTLDGTQVQIPIADIFAKENWVIFEDYEGIFMLKPENIISIEILGDNNG